MINGIDLRTLRNSEFLQFITDFSAFIEANDPVALDVLDQHSVLKAKIAETQPLFNQQQASKLTPQLQLINKRRDKAITGIRYAIKSYCHHFDDQTMKSANLLATHLRQFGNYITRQNCPTKTTTINAIVSDWESKPKFIASLARLGLNVWVTELKTANQLFYKKYFERTQEYAEASPGTMKGKREETVAAYYELRKFLDANAVIRSDAGYEKVINALNVLIEQYNVLLNWRKTLRSKHSGDKETDYETA
ncbi:MAG: DUF6261 family protein [Bacteroidia bacterium]|nr:DUF6261 family protein [Bacteroidia bacterium]